MTFELHRKLAADGTVIGRFDLGLLLLSDDANYPWFIYVPQREGIREIHELADADQLLLLRESVRLSRALMAAFEGHKLNVAALGNVVPQLHLHHIVRYTTDPAWPAPIWSKVPARAYTDAERGTRIETLHAALGAGYTPAF